jgi:hypothetical protein
MYASGASALTSETALYERGNFTRRSRYPDLELGRILAKLSRMTESRRPQLFETARLVDNVRHCPLDHVHLSGR